MDDPDIEDVVQRFLADISECVEGLNMALPHFDKELISIKFDQGIGSFDIELEDRRVVH